MVGEYQYITGDEMTLEMFEEYFWNYINETLVSNIERDVNREWSDSLVHDAWRIYSYSGLDKNIIFKIIEQVVFATKRYEPKFD